MSTHRFKSTSPLGALLIRAALMLALCLLAVSTSAPVSAQQSERTITGLTLSSEEPGELAVSWDAASPAPVDYRVSWARSDEDYRTWTDDSGNAYPTTNSLTLTGLDEGVEYKVQVRARYGNLSGPWSDEARLTVAGADGAPSPTPEPTPEPIAPDPADADLAPRNLTVSQVNGWARLSWEEPVADADSVTGYEILRRRPGRGEAELRTLVADTDSTETVYEDRTANEPGVLYAYRVKALRGAVKSVQSNFVNFVSAGDAPGSPAGVPRLLMEGEMRVGYVRDELWERLTDIYGYSLYTGVGELIVSWHVPDDQQFTVGALGHTADVEDGTGALHFGVSRWLEYPFVLGVGDRALSSRQALRIDGGPPLYRWSGGCSDWTEGQTVPVSVRRVSEDDPLYTQSMDDASLGVLSVEGDELSPAFTPETLSYHADVGWEVESVKVVAEASAAGSCGVEFSPEQDAGGRIDLSEGENLIEVTVTAADGETMSTYAVLIRRAEAPYEDGAGLSGLRMSEVPGLEFEPQRQRYTVEVPERTDQTTVSALGSESGTRVEVVAVRAGEPLAFDGTDEDPGSGGHQVRLSGSGETLLLVRAESEDGARLRLYSLNLRQAESTSGARSSAVLKRDNRAGGSSVRAPRNQGGTGPRLSSLSLGSVALSPTFSAETFAYEASVGHDVGVVTVSAVPASGGTLIISPPDADADADGWQVNLSASMPGGDPAQTLIIVVVRSADGTRLESYVITVTRAAPPSDDASLSSLSIGGLELTPAFGPDVLEYEARVDSDTAVVTVSANTAHADATYVVSPEESADEEATPGYQVELAEGENTITITVTAKDGVTTKTYTVTVNRAGPPSSDARLRTLSLAEAELTPAFSPDTSVYAAAVGWQVTRVTVTLEANESDARLAVSPPDADPAGGYQLDLPVAEPDGTAESVVLVVASTAPDGVGRQTYLLTVTRDARPSDDDASLSGLSLEGLELMPAFDSETLVYEATAPDEAESITVTATATASDAGATVTIAPVDADPDTDDNQVKLTRRSNPVNITVTVTAPDGVTTQNYTVAVHHNFGRGGFVQVDAGWDYACGLRVDGTLTCWQIMLDPRQSETRSRGHFHPGHAGESVRLRSHNRRLCGMLG